MNSSARCVAACAAWICLLSVLAPAAGYMTRYECATFDGMVAGNNLTVADDEPDKVNFFCKEHVNYTAACDMDIDPALGFNPSCNNTFAIQVFSNFQRALSVYSCREYSRIWTCDNCTVSYKRWLCAALYRRCKHSNPSEGSCESNFSRTNDKALPDCVMKTCQDVCYDVVRKCPVHLEFRCPPQNDLREYNLTDCNNLMRPQPASGSGNRLAGASLLFLPVLLALLKARG